MAKKQSKIDQINQTKAQIDSWWKSAESRRSNYDWKWFLYDLWVGGYHYAKWDKETRQITSVNEGKGKVKITINMVYVTLRAVRNFVLRNRPRAEATPDDLTPENISEVINLNRYLDYLHDHLSLRRKIKATLWHALKYSVGFWQVLWDEEEKEVSIDVVDPYDLYFDPVARKPEEARYVFLAIRRPVDLVTHDPKYAEYIKKNEIELKGDGKLAASHMKERFISIEETQNQNEGNAKDDTILVKECWFKEWSEDQSKFVIKLCTFAGEEMIREPEETDLDRFPFFRLQSDVEPLRMYAQGWVKNLIPVNKLLNRLESNVAEYNDLINRGKWVSDKGAGVRVINNEHGQIIEKKRGFDVHQEPITPLNVSVFRQIENANRYIEDIGGKHDASMGRMPTGAKSGKALEALQVGDSNNMSEIVENLEEFLEDVFEYVLHLVSQKYQFARRIIPLSKTGERDFITVIGESASNIPDGATVIKANNTVDVKVTSWLAETQEARREVLKELYELQAIDQETLLKGYGISNVAGVIQQTMVAKETERQAETEQQLMLANAQNQGKQQPAPEAPPAQAGALQANAALQELLSGNQPEIPKDAGPDFLAYIDQFIQAPEFSQLSPDEQKLVQSFRNQVAVALR